MYFLGPKGSSKSLFLINFCFIFDAMQIPTLYINYKILKNLDEKKRKYIFKREIVYLFHDFEKFKDFYNAKYHRLIKGENNDFLNGLKEFIKTLLNIYENTFDEKIILIIIDNFDEDNENIFSEMENLINLVKENSKKIKLIISGNSTFLIKKFELFYINKNFSDIIKKQALFLYDIKLENKNEIKSLAAFYNRKISNDVELECTLLNEEIQYCRKFNLFGLYFSIVNNRKNIKMEKILKYIYLIPLEYLIFKINDDKSIKFEYFNSIFFKAVQQYIDYEIKEKNLESLLKNDNNDILFNIIYEEKLLNMFISYNKLNLENMEIPENNFLEVDKICEFKYKINQKNSKNLGNNLPIIINPKEFEDEFYDLLILVPKKDIFEKIIIFKAYMIKIGSNKIWHEILEIRDDFDKNKNFYLDGIKYFFDNKIIIKNIELLFIFDMETQNNLLLNKTRFDLFGAKYCFKNRIRYYCFSHETYKLYKSFDNRVYLPVKKFGDFDEYHRRNWLSYLLEIFNFLEDEDIDFINSKIKNGTIEDFGIFVKENTKFEDIEIDNNNIYVLKNDMNIFFVINCKIYNNFYDDFIIVNEIKIIENKEVFDIYILTPVNIYDGLKKQSK